jgi:catechol 2,3-dioxygenase-like lactoylglutathione lyase family enzyme
MTTNNHHLAVRRLQHVSVPRPPGRDAHDRAVAFYQDLLGLPEIPKPSTFTDIDVTWFRLGDTEIHVYAQAETESSPDSDAHFCLVVEDLQAARAQLEAAGYSATVPTAIPGRPRFNIRDPFGNQIEVTTLEDGE